MTNTVRKSIGRSIWVNQYRDQLQDDSFEQNNMSIELELQVLDKLQCKGRKSKKDPP